MRGFVFSSRNLFQCQQVIVARDNGYRVHSLYQGMHNYIKIVNTNFFSNGSVLSKKDFWVAGWLQYFLPTQVADGRARRVDASKSRFRGSFAKENASPIKHRTSQPSPKA
jgi:hypothetical protein